MRATRKHDNNGEHLAIYTIGMDLIRLMLTRIGQMKYAVVAIDYFTKRIEVEPLQKINEKRTIYFILRNVICRYGLP